MFSHLRYQKELIPLVPGVPDNTYSDLTLPISPTAGAGPARWAAGLGSHTRCLPPGLVGASNEAHDDRGELRFGCSEKDHHVAVMGAESTTQVAVGARGRVRVGEWQA